jgi:hypothetical protein
LAAVSAALFPDIPLCAGIHCILTGATKLSSQSMAWIPYIVYRFAPGHDDLSSCTAESESV